MACHEIAALRLGLMNVLGGFDESEREHERAELGALASAPGALATLASTRELRALRERFEHALVGLEEKVAKTAASAPERPYLASLMVLTKKVELELNAHVEGMARFCQELEEMHDFVHELYPAEEG
ncbi:MAG: DUF3209 family protein [Myxococcales bacterium]